VRKLAVGVVPPVREVILDASAIPRLDTTAADVVVDLVDELDAAEVELVLARASHRLRTDLHRFGLAEGRVAFVESVGVAVQEFLAREA
jgi:anti-anti-sigma regulatory factor